MPLRKIFIGLAVVCWPGGKAAGADLPPVGVTLVPARTAFASFAEYSQMLWFGPIQGFATIHSAHLEIRFPGESHRMLRIRWPYDLNAPVADRRKIRLEGSRSGFAEDQLRLFRDCPPGAYRIAFFLNGVRASNVAEFSIDPAAEQANLPVLALSATEPNPLTKLARPLLRVCAHRSIDPKLTNYAIVTAPVEIDGTLRRRRGMVWTGPIGPITGQFPFAQVIDVEIYEPVADPGSPHQYRFAFGNYPAAELDLDPHRHPLADEWERDTERFREAPLPASVLEGDVVDSKGGPAAGAVVILGREGSFAFQELTDESGHYAFRGIPEGVYSVSCALRPSEGHPMFTEEEVDLKQVRKMDFDFRNGYLVAGRVVDSQGQPTARVAVNGTWVGPSGQQFLSTALSDKEGRYEMRGPFPKLSFVGVASSGAHSPPHHDVKAGRNDIDFRLGAK